MSNQILKSIKDEYAMEQGYNNWEYFFLVKDEFVIDDSWDTEIAKRYALACCKATLERAAENAVCELGENKGYGPIDKSSITDSDNIVIL